MVGKTLKIADDVQNLGDVSAVLFRHILGGELDQIRAERILVDVHLVLNVADLLRALFVVFVKQRNTRVQRVERKLRHTVGHLVGVLDGDGGRIEQAIVEHGRVFVALLVVSPDGGVGHANEQIGDGKRQRDSQHLIDGIDDGDGEHIDRGGVCPCENVTDADGLEDPARQVGKAEPEDNADDVGIQVSRSGALTVLVGADGREHGGHAGTDRRTKQDRDGRSVGDGARYRQCLKDTRRGAGRLHGHGEDHTGKHAEDGIFKHGKELCKVGIALEAADRVGHERHADHQHSKAEQNGGRILVLVLFGKHQKNDTRQRKQRHPGIRLKIAEPSGGIRTALNAVKCSQPGGDGCTKVTADANAERLRERHGTRVDKADDKDRRCAGALNDGGDSKTEQKALHLARGQVTENGFESLSGALLQSRSHDVHSVKEQRQAAEHG